MRISKPRRSIYLTHKGIAPAPQLNKLELSTGDEAKLVTKNESVYGIIDTVAYYKGEPFIELYSTNPVPAIFYISDLVSIGGIKLDNYDITIQDYIGEYELELDHASPSIMLSRGDLIEVTYTDRNGTYKVAGILRKVAEQFLSVSTYSIPKDTMLNTILFEESIQDVQILARAEDNNIVIGNL